MHDDAELKRLHWRAHHRGTREADMLVGGFFDAHSAGWSADERMMFAAMLEEQDIDIMAWAHDTLPVPARFQGPMIEALKRLDYIQVAK
ncbi:MAG: succinate dehydrogenase assembly factor 2 [Sphingomicrobium sp.]